MEKRKLGKTDIQSCLIGFGGFHLVELTAKDAANLLNLYLDKGGNYIETAPGYGNGNSEIKIGSAVSHRRDEFILATKCFERDKGNAKASIHNSLRNLKTDTIDILFVHGLQRQDELDTVISSNGALEASLEAKDAGKIRYIAVSSHGQPKILYKGLQAFDFDLFMIGLNFYDRFNYPELEEIVIPYALKHEIGIIGMKSLADGYLYKNWENAIRYTLSLPISCLVLGINTHEQLEKDLALAEAFQPMTDDEKETLYRSSPELGNYVCRQCGECKKNGFDPAEVFLLEGVYDRQMDDRVVGDTAQYALRERLRFWFEQNEEAKAEYRDLKAQVDPDSDYSELNDLCPYGIDIDRKLKIAHEKLSSSDYMY